jgi:hypothetical protein
MPTCNSFNGKSLTDAACLIGQKAEPANLGNSEIDPLKFLFLVADMIEQLRLDPGTIATLSAINMCDAAETLRLGNCHTQFVTFPPNVTMATLQAVILTQLNEALCT